MASISSFGSTALIIDSMLASEEARGQSACQLVADHASFPDPTTPERQRNEQSERREDGKIHHGA